MKNELKAFVAVIVFCFGNLHAWSFSHNIEKTITFAENGRTSERVAKHNIWVELGDVNMTAYFDDSYHWVTATLYRFGNNGQVYRIFYEDKYYTVRTEMFEGEIKYSVWILYQGEKRCFSFSLQDNGIY